MRKINKISVCNMECRSGREVSNQFIITTDKGTYFQSYRSIVAFKPFEQGRTTKTGKIIPSVYLDKRTWNYSRTTGKYLNKFLGEGKAETEKKIKEGIYKLVGLN